MQDITCASGKIRLADGILSIVQFKNTIWSAPAEQITAFTTQPGQFNSYDVTIHAIGGTYLAKMVTKANFAKLQEAFPGLTTQTASGAWYDHPTALTHLETYTNDKALQRDMDAAYTRGWMIQGQSSTAGHVNVGRTSAKLLFTGGLGLLTGVSRSKDKTTITWVRTPEWHTQHPH